jgi:hypothetical protein
MIQGSSETSGGIEADSHLRPLSELLQLNLFSAALQVHRSTSISNPAIFRRQL